MKLYKPYYLALAVILMFVLNGVYSCKKEKATQIDITGSWIHDLAGVGGISRETYLFNADSTMQYTRTLIDSTTKQLLGYGYLSKGKYSFNGTTLKLYQLSNYYYYNPSGKPPYYTPVQDLVIVKTDTTVTYQTSFSADRTSFTFIYPPCPINANCIGAVTYKKQ